MVDSLSGPSASVVAADAVCVLASIFVVGDNVLPAARLGMRGAIDAVRRELAAGRYAVAESRAAALYQTIAAAREEQSAPALQALDLWVEASWRNGKAASADVVARGERAVALWERRTGRNRPDVAPALHNLAEESGPRTASSKRRWLCTNARSPNGSLPCLTTTERRQTASTGSASRSSGSSALQRRAERLSASLRIREPHAGQNALPLARTLQLTALAQRADGDYPQAELSLARAVAIRERLAPEHPDNVSLLQLRGDVLFLRGDARGAKALWAESLSLGERTLGPSHSAIPEILRRLGMASHSEGNLAEARQLRERALRVAEITLSPCDSELVALMFAMAVSLDSDGEYPEAQRQTQRALATTERCFGSTSLGASDARATASNTTSRSWR